MKQTWSIQTVNTNHESITVVTTRTLLKAVSITAATPEALWCSRKEHRAKALGPESLLSYCFIRTELDKRFTSLDLGSHWHEETELDTSLQTAEAESWLQLCPQNKEIEGDMHWTLLSSNSWGSAEQAPRASVEYNQKSGEGRWKYLLQLKHFPALNSQMLCAEIKLTQPHALLLPEISIRNWIKQLHSINIYWISTRR